MSFLVSTRQFFGKKSTASWGSVIGICLLVYFTYYAIQGPRGLIVYNHLRNQVKSAENLLASVQGEKKTLEDKVHLLRPASISPDMLDEQARTILNYSHPDDVIILSPSSPSP